jgi:hypothetical protein
MATSSTSFEGITPIPAKITGLNAGVFAFPAETGENYSIAIAPNYNYYRGVVVPPANLGVAGDWYDFVDAATSTIKVYQKQNSITWQLITTLG